MPYCHLPITLGGHFPPQPTFLSLTSLGWAHSLQSAAQAGISAVLCGFVLHFAEKANEFRQRVGYGMREVVTLVHIKALDLWVFLRNTECTALFPYLNCVEALWQRGNFLSTFGLFSLAANKTVLHLLIAKLIDSLSTGSELNFKANPRLQGFSWTDDSRACLLSCSHRPACSCYYIYQECVML